MNIAHFIIYVIIITSSSVENTMVKVHARSIPAFSHPRSPAFSSIRTHSVQAPVSPHSVRLQFNTQLPTSAENSVPFITNK